MGKTVGLVSCRERKGSPDVVTGWLLPQGRPAASLLELKEWKTRLGAHWTFLYDAKRIIKQELEIQENTDPLDNPMIPHTILLEPDLKVFRPQQILVMGPSYNPGSSGRVLGLFQ